MGFNGYDQNGKALWDKFTNIKPKHIEVRHNCEDVLLKMYLVQKQFFIRNFFNALLVCNKRSRISQKLEHFDGKMVEKVRTVRN